MVTGPVAGSTNSRDHAELLIQIRIRRHDKTLQETQGADSERYIASVIAGTTEHYADQKSALRILCGSV
jgi:hypothetical protein